MGARPAFTAPNDQPWSQPFRFWLDQARTQPLMLTGAGGWLQFPGGSSKVALEASDGGNVATLSMAQGDLAALRLGTWWGELQYAYGGYNVGSLRFDLLVAIGLGTGLGASAGSGAPTDCIVLDAAPLDIITVFAGSAAAPFLSLSPALQARLGVSNVDDALAAIAQPLPADVQTELLSSLGGTSVTLQQVLVLLCQRAGLLSPGRGDYNPNL